MKEKSARRYRAYLCTAAIVATAWTAVAQPSNAWMRAGSHPADYEMGLDNTTAFTGSSSGYLRSAKTNSQGFGTYMQVFDAQIPR